jgi:hypothetical protein
MARPLYIAINIPIFTHKLLKVRIPHKNTRKVSPLLPHYGGCAFVEKALISKRHHKKYRGEFRRIPEFRGHNTDTGCHDIFFNSISVGSMRSGGRGY